MVYNADCVSVYWYCHPHRVLEDVVIHVKVGRVSGRGHVGDVGSFSTPDVVPVNPAEEWVALEVRDPVQTKPTFS